MLAPLPGRSCVGFRTGGIANAQPPVTGWDAFGIPLLERMLSRKLPDNSKSWYQSLSQNVVWLRMKCPRIVD